MKRAKVLGKFTGAVPLVVSVIKLKYNPTTANKISVGVNAVAVCLGPIGSIVSGVLDVTGVTDKVITNVANSIDGKNRTEGFKPINENSINNYIIGANNGQF